MKTLKSISIAHFRKIVWEMYEDNPVIRPPLFSPIIADPTFLTPDMTPNGDWQLFAHSVWGVHRYSSPDGVAFKHNGIVARHAMRPFIFKENGLFTLVYEKYRPFHLMYSMLPKIPWKSTICLRQSENLQNWSNPITILKPSLPWHSNVFGSSVGNPCVLKTKNNYTLFYSSSLVRIPDCGFNEPEHIGMAVSPNLTSFYTPDVKPVISPEPDNPYHNLSSGSVKVIEVKDGFIGFQNRIYIDKNTGQSGSAIFLLFSKNLKKWALLKKEPVIKPANGWMRSHVYAMDIKLYNNTLYLYFNGRNDWHWTKGKEAIGFAIGMLK